ncbi:selenocysteine-specific translation elongation factor [Virgisporangium ochraceum]|uniref:Selenocysteine-specific translation elongation factor n=1 Tax=Virgisporangium ochraceum TaxID=65505 RepID=A0A8J4A0H4_9ACTN|nr:selenocysteine-specific translation elongation factor [Virgisporangium ochraceum]GIJ70701.1 selenocysteine-specific translation elongation factor [Virgisporangium ochraceum]
MHVLATAGHVDHGKSTLIRNLTGMEPDRLAEERTRGLTIDLGFAWMTLPSRRQVAFVDVPGHERFLGTMLAGVGPVPAVLFVVAADEGWKPQSEEHLAALDALGVRHGLLVVTRSDLADPAPALAAARERLARSSLGTVPAVAVSAATGAGLPRLVAAIDEVTSGLPEPDRTAPVRLWLDRSFTIRGSGVVVTGTLGAGTVDIGDELELSPSRQRVQVRGLQTLERPARSVGPVARVAVNLRGAERSTVSRGMALLTPGRWSLPDVVDVRLDRPGDAEESDWEVPGAAVLHVGSGRTVVRIRPLAHDRRRLVARLALRDRMPLHVGDRAVLRDPGQSHGETRVLGRVTVLDVRPPALRRRGDAARRGLRLLELVDVPDGAVMLDQHGVLRLPDFTLMGVAPPDVPAVGEWLIHPDHRRRMGERLVSLVTGYAVRNPLERGMPVDAARRALDLPHRRLVDAVLPSPLRIVEGRIRRADQVQELPGPLARAVGVVVTRLAEAPFRAPEHQELAALGLDRKGLAAAERTGHLLRIADGVVLAPGADEEAARILAGLPQPFSASDARRALDTTRRVIIPLLELLDRGGYTERVDANQRRCRTPATSP